MALQDKISGVDFVYDHKNGGFQVGNNNDYTQIDGIQNIINWCYHCLITNPGEYKLRPTFGVGLPNRAKQKQTPANLSNIKNTIISSFRLNARITSATPVVTSQGNMLFVNINIVVNNQQLQLPQFQFSG